jgi:epoxyqueuosine reductase
LESTQLQEQLKLIVSQYGGDLYGVADLTPARDFIVDQGGPALGEYPRAISIGLRLIDSILEMHSPDEPRDLSNYWHHVYSVVTPQLDFLSYRVAHELQKEGYRAFPVGGSLPSNIKTFTGIFSHKLAAHQAGLGWIGKSCLLITPEYGPRVRFTTILTDAPLTPGTPLNKSCGKCQICTNSCPAHAIKDREFRPDEPLNMRYDPKACFEYRHTHPCGVCVAVCPHKHRKKTT